MVDPEDDYDDVLGNGRFLKGSPLGGREEPAVLGVLGKSFFLEAKASKNSPRFSHLCWYLPPRAFQGYTIFGIVLVRHDQGHTGTPVFGSTI